MAAASVKIAEANVQAAEMNVEKVKPLVEKDIISKYELQSNEYTLRSHQASLASAQANLVNAKVNVGYTSINSPANGVIGSLPYKVGSLVSSTSANPLTTVYNTKNVYAYFSLNEKQLLGFTRSARGKTLEDKLANPHHRIRRMAGCGSKRSFQRAGAVWKYFCRINATGFQPGSEQAKARDRPRTIRRKYCGIPENPAERRAGSV